MSNSTSVNNSFADFRARPVSHLAAAVFLGTSVYVAHHGLQQLLPGQLGAALTALFVAVAVLQWLALGRKEACENQRDTDRADAVIQQAWMFGVIETVLYAAGGLSLAAQDGLAVWNAWGVGIASVGAIIFAVANFRVKWVSCDGVRTRRPPPTNGGTHAEIFSEPSLPALEAVPTDSDWENDPTVVRFQKRLRHTNSVEAKDAPARASAERPAGERLRLSAKRLRMRAAREAQRVAA